MPSALSPIIDRDHTRQLTVLQRFWIGALLLQLGTMGLAMSAVPKYDTGRISLSVGVVLASAMLFGLALYLIARWERASLARIPVEISDALSTLGGEGHRFVFADPRDALDRALRAETPPILLRLALVTGMAFAALLTRYQGASLPFALTLHALSLYLTWRTFPTIPRVVARLEDVKGVRFVAAPSPLVEPPVHFAAPI